jgi:hypothetical protein
MAARNDDKPTFDVIVEAMTVLATQFGRMPNMPAVNQGAHILEELRAFRRDVGEQFIKMGIRLDV